MSVFQKAMDQLATELESRGCKTKLVGTDLYRMSVKPRPSGRGCKRNYLKNCRKTCEVTKLKPYLQ